jgi:uncharacterized membrane protein
MQNMSGGKTALDLDANVGAMICYLGNLICALGLIYSIIVVIQDKTNKLARFHAFQSIFLSVAGLVIGIPLYIVMFILVFWIMAAVKAYNGQIYKIPVIGNFADKYSN